MMIPRGQHATAADKIKSVQGSTPNTTICVTVMVQEWFTNDQTVAIFSTRVSSFVYKVKWNVES